MTHVTDVAIVVLTVCAALVSVGLYAFLHGKGHESASRGDHLLAIIRWRDESDAAEDDE